MIKKKAEFKGGVGVIMLLVAMGFAGFRFSGMSDIQDEKLRNDLMLHLSDSGGDRFIYESRQNGVQDESEGANSILSELQQPVKLHSIKMSAPLLEWSNTQDVILRVEYSKRSTASQKPQVKYLRYLKRSLGSWEYRGVTGASSYYMNFF